MSLLAVILYVVSLYFALDVSQERPRKGGRLSRAARNEERSAARFDAHACVSGLLSAFLGCSWIAKFTLYVWCISFFVYYAVQCAFPPCIGSFVV